MTAASVSTTADRGNLTGLWVVVQSQRALEFHISVFHRVKASKVVTVCINRPLHSIQQVALDAVLELKGLEVLSQRRSTVLLEVSVLIVLLNMKIYILVKIEVLALAFIPEELQLGANGAPVGTTCWPPRRTVCRVWYTWHPFLDLLNFFMWLHQPDLPQ